MFILDNFDPIKFDWFHTVFWSAESIFIAVTESE